MAEQLAEVRSYDELITALRDRVSKLGVTCESIDDLAGMPQRYTNKLLSQASGSHVWPSQPGTGGCSP